MDCPDFEHIRTLLLDSTDSEVVALVRVLDPIFRSVKFRPSADTPPRERDLIAAVRAIFPTPFARKFDVWAELDDELDEALATWSNNAADSEQRRRAEARLPQRIRAAQVEIETCWKRIVHFLPFLLIAALRRLDDEVLRRDAARELARVLRNYNAFYVRFDSERQLEAIQYELLVALLKLFRQLSAKGDLDDDFLFAPLMKTGGGGFGEIFPERFDAAMLLLHQVRNRLTHRGLADRLPRALPVEGIRAVGDLVKWCFLDIVAVLAPLCQAFSLGYVTESRTGDVAAEVQMLDFSGLTGPRDARYRLSKEPQPEQYACLPYRMYLIARDKQMGTGSGAMLTPRDYLDLTPFLIVERLRSTAARRDLSPADRNQLMFALQQYLEPMRRLLFFELEGGGDTSRPTGSDDAQGDQLLRQIGDFKNRISQLTAQVTIGDQRRVSIPNVVAQLWHVSKEHLATLLETDRYDQTGHLLAEMPGSELRPVYNADLFVEPGEGAALAAFQTSDRRGLLLVGDSGAGKSNLLTHHYLAGLRGGRLAVFLTGRRLEQPSFRDVLVARVVTQIGGWSGLDNLNEFLEENDEVLTIFIDAVNEYSGPQGPRALLESLIGAVQREPLLRRCKVVASYRSETWAQYRTGIGHDRPLDPAVFFTADGDAVRVGRFEVPEQCRLLYQAYQRHYDLRPHSYEALSAPVRALIAEPLMMAMVAETCSNRAPAADEPPREVPPDLDYFSLFEKLTDRKAQDAQILVPVADLAERAAMPEAIEEFCELLAEMIFERLTTSDRSIGSGRDAVPIDNVNKRAELERFVQSRHSISVLEAVLQVGLVDQVAITQRNRQGRLVSSAAFAFFHDQYTQYWLAAAYQQSVLGWLDAETLGAAAKLDALVGRLDRIVTSAVEAPVLAGALDHWFEKNLSNFHDHRLDPVVPLLDRLAEHDSPALHYQVVALVTRLILRGYLAPARVYGPIFRSGSPRLRLELVNAFVEFWPQLQPAAVQAFIDACDPTRDSAALERLGDVFALHLLLDPAEVVDYLGKAISPLSLAGIREPLRIWRQSRFVLQFTVFSVMSCFDQPASVRAVREFVRAKYRPVLDLVDESGRGSRIGQVARRTLRTLLYPIFDSFGVAQWNKFIAEMPESGNAQFFEALDGVVQHQVLAEFLPFVIDLHNGEFDRLSLAPGSPFRALAIRMLDFRPTSVIGYNALIALPSILLHQDWAVTQSLVLELIERRTPSVLFYGQLLLANLSYSDPSLARPALELMRDRLVPLLLRNRLECDWSIFFCIAMLDVETLWPIFEAILDQLFDHFESIGDAAACAGFGDHLYKACYCHDSMLGRRLVGLLLGDAPRFLGPMWRVCTMKVLAAMLTRSPAALQAALAAAGADESLLREARTYRSDEIVKQSRLFPFQVDVNRFVAWVFVAEPRLRYAVVKYIIGSLAAGSSVADFPPGVRQMLVALINVFFGDHADAAPQGRLSVEEVASAVAAARGGRRGRAAHQS